MAVGFNTMLQTSNLILVRVANLGVILDKSPPAEEYFFT